MRILICGSRGYTDRALMERSIPWNEVTLVIEGAARGADAMAGELARAHGIPVDEHPANWDLYGKSAGYKRNTEMLDLDPDRVYAFWDRSSRGTAHTIREARARLGEDRVIVIRY